MALGMLVTGMFSDWFEEPMGYQVFVRVVISVQTWFVNACLIPLTRCRQEQDHTW